MNYFSTHSAFNDTIDSLKNEFKDDKSNTVIVFGSQHIPFSEFCSLKEKYDKIIVFQMEPLTTQQKIIWSSSGQNIDKNYFAWLKHADEVWDYDEQNFEILNLIRPDVKLHTLKPYKNWNLYPPVEKDIDILFYGVMNEHRSIIINELKKRHNVVVLTDCWNQNLLDQYILRSKILLNLHYYYDAACQEQARMIRWIGAPCRIVSEKSHKNYLNVEEFDYEDLVKI